MEIAILICVVGFLFVMALRGYMKGFVKLFLSMFAIIIALIISYTATPILTNALKGTELYNIINAPISDYVREKMTTGEHIDHIDNVTNEIQIKASEFDEILDNLNLPDAVVDFLDRIIEENNWESVGAASFADVMAEELTTVVLSVIVFIIVFIVITIICRILIGLLNILSRLPIISTFNRTLGVLLALSEAMIIIWILCLVLVILSGTGIGDEILNAVKENAFLNLIYSNNLIAGFLL